MLPSPATIAEQYLPRRSATGGTATRNWEQTAAIVCLSWDEHRVWAPSLVRPDAGCRRQPQTEQRHPCDFPYMEKRIPFGRPRETERRQRHYRARRHASVQEKVAHVYCT